jgi:hypothetical protein
MGGKQPLACLVILAGIAVAPGGALAGAWVQDPGTAYIRVTSGYLASDERFDQEGDRVPWDASGGGFRDSQYQELAATLYAEVGIAAGWNAVASVPWSRVQADQPTAVFTTYGVGDITLALKRALSSGGGTVSSAMVGFAFPGGYDETEYPALGAGVREGSILAQVGHSWGSPWANLEAEVRVRGGGHADQLRGALGGGMSANRWIAFRAEARGVLSLFEEMGILPAAPVGTGSPPFDPAAADPTYLDLAGTVSVHVTRGVALEGEVRSTVRGENTLAGTRWTLAVATSPAWRFREEGR